MPSPHVHVEGKSDLLLDVPERLALYCSKKATVPKLILISVIEYRQIFLNDYVTKRKWNIAYLPMNICWKFPNITMEVDFGSSRRILELKQLLK